jgi:hypothetical protein
MKRIIILFLLFLTKIGFAQETEFKLTKEGFTDFLVINCENKSQAELYKKTLEWIAVTYNTPSAVTKGAIENDYIRIEGFANHVISSGTKYQIEISFKDGKYKFDIIKIEFISGFDGEWKEFDITNTAKYLDKDGRVVSKSKVWERVIKYFNNLNTSLKNFVLSEQIPSKKKDW